MRTGINALTVAFVVGVLAGLLLTPDGRGWLRHPTFLLGGSAAASASPPERQSARTTAPTMFTADVPAIAQPAVIRLRPRPGQPLRIGVFGDSMAEGLHAALYRELHAVPGVTVTRFSEVSTGLSRYDYVNIQTKTERQIADTPIDAAVIMFGTNDAQGIEINGQVHAFGTPGWRQAYGQRIENLVTALRAKGVAVYWVGMPRMRRDTFEAKMDVVNTVAEARLRQLGVPWLDTRPLTSGGDGTYAAYLNDTRGRRVQMRAGDGIHMSMAGYERMGRPMAQTLLHDAGLEPLATGAP